MSFTWPDIALIAIMLISGLLALMRGFVREVLSLVAWGAAAAAAVVAVFNDQAKAFVGQYLQPEIVATIALGAGVFLVVLVILSVIGAKLADAMLDSSAGPFDRTIGFFYGLLRGLLLVVAAFLFYVWLTPREKINSQVRNAMLLPLVESASEITVSLLTDFGVMSSDVADTLRGKGAPGQSQSTTKQDNAQDGEDGYRDNQRRTLDQIIESTQGTQQ